MGNRKKKTVRKVRVAHELPKRRRIAIDEAMKAVSYTHLTLPTTAYV